VFSQIHHRSLNNQSVTIERHMNYYRGLGSFREDSVQVQRRLELILNAYRGGGFRTTGNAIFRALADAALFELPTVRG
jgi:hypothetical protein